MAVGIAAVACVGLGLALTSGWAPPGEIALENLRRSLRVTGGAVLFGAGLLHMSMWRLGEGATRAYAGAALVVLGLLTTLTSGTGHLLHGVSTAATLNPLIAAWTALASLGLLLTALSSGIRHRAPQLLRPSTIAVGLATVTMVALGVLAEVRRQVPFEIALSPAAHVQLELLVAAAWLSAAVYTHHRTRHSDRLPALSAEVLGCLALLWVLRAAAVTDVTAWGVASAALLAAVAVVVLTTATSDFVDATEAEHTRADEAEQAVVSAAYELQRHDDDTRSLNHEARNMLLALRTASQTLADYGDRLSEEARHELEHAIAAEAVKLDQLIAERAREARERRPGPTPPWTAPAAGFVPAQRKAGAVLVDGAR